MSKVADVQPVTYPNTWLLRYATVIPFSSVTQFMVSKRHRRHLRHNTAWKEQCKSLPDYHLLTESEAEGLQPENFWYTWYVAHCIRVAPLMPPILTPLKYSNRPGDVCTFHVPRVGSMIMSYASGSGQNERVLVVTRVLAKGSKLNPKVPNTFYIAKSNESLQEAIRAQKCTYTRASEYQVLMRDNGNFSIPLNVLTPEEYH